MAVVEDLKAAYFKFEEEELRELEKIKKSKNALSKNGSHKFLSGMTKTTNYEMVRQKIQDKIRAKLLDLISQLDRMYEEMSSQQINFEDARPRLQFLSNDTISRCSACIQNIAPPEGCSDQVRGPSIDE